MAGITYRNPSEGSAVAWVGDELKQRERVVVTGGLLNAAAFPMTGAVTATVGSAGAAAGATSVPTAALSGPIPSGATLDFGGAKFARLTADAASGATALTVAALPTALAAGDAATYTPDGARRYVESGTLVGRTFDEELAGVGFGPFATGDGQVYLLLHDVYDADRDNSATFYRRGSLVYTRHLPAAMQTTAMLAAIREHFQTQRGEA